jgi:NAD(P)-dependent dehydrogenase (short-subunit alcohol dehydrogenase family)
MKNIIVTGATGNLGDAVLRHFLETGYYVIAPVHSAGGINFQHERLEVHTVDATDSVAVKDFVQNFLQVHSGIDGLIALVGGFAPGTMEKTTTADIRKMISLNFDTAYNFVQPVLAQMKRQDGGGKIFLVGSRPGMTTSEARTSVAYGLAKSLVFRLGEIINAEHKNISATVFVPGTIDTPDNRKAMPNADISKWNNPMDIAARMEDVMAGKEEGAVIEFS